MSETSTAVRRARARFAPPAEVSAQRVVMTPLDPSEYEDRVGYDPKFIPSHDPVPLPTFSAAIAADVIKFKVNGKQDHVLRYTHFSTAMSKSRRLPFFSAVNIDGKQEKDVPRTDVWRFDPRIPVKFQILKECYGSEQNGMFSRGHQTRRKDPDWGTLSVSKVADADTFHATNAAPQMQRFNDGTWGDIEDFILNNANKDNMRISVITGPVFDKSDPVLFGVKIPLTFWKVVIFVHDETGELTATAYTASQADNIKPAFVFGEFRDHQVPVERVERLSKLKFGDLKTRDPLHGAGPNFAVRLKSVTDIMLD
jgi:endonuclease G